MTNSSFYMAAHSIRYGNDVPYPSSTLSCRFLAPTWSTFHFLPPPACFGRILSAPSGVSIGLQSPIRSRARLPVGLGSSNESPVPYKPKLTE